MINAPDIIMDPAEGYWMTSRLGFDSSIVERKFKMGSGIHQREGIITTSGPSFGLVLKTRSPASIMDVAPEVLRIFDMKPEGIDGCEGRILAS